MRNKFTAILAGVMALSLTLGLCGCAQEKEVEVVQKNNFDTYEELESYLLSNIDSSKEVKVWYTDETDVDFMEAAATEFKNTYGVSVTPTLYTGIDYLEDINNGNINGDAPDVFLLGNDQIRKANLSGLVDENDMFSDKMFTDNYPTVSKNALTTDKNIYGFPIYFDTCFLVYNSSIVENQPETFDEILEFANNFEDTEGNKTIFKWNVADMFYDYIFLGGYAKVLGDFGEDKSNFDLTTDKSIESMTYFQNLSQYFSMDAYNNSYEEIKEELAAGTLIFSICKTDIISYIESDETSYKLAPLPNLTSDLASCPVSITYSAMINDYSHNKNEANLFAAFLSYKYAGNIYSVSKKIAASTLNRTDENEIAIYDQYTKSKAIPKALEMGDFWAYGEIKFKNIWNGKDVTTELQDFEDYMNTRFK